MKLIASLAALAMLCTAGYAQTLLHPVSAADGGGGTSAGGGFTLLGSVGQTAAGVTTDADTGISIEGGIIPPLREGSGVTLTTGVLVQTAWNMISIPVIPPDPRKTVLLPTAISSAFVYLPPPSGYATEDTLLPGVGFWAKFPGVETIPFTGTGLTLDTIPVNAGWNIIGSLSYPSLTTDVVPVGGVSVLSSYFAFLGGFGYTSEDTLEPGRAYWVKVNQPGAIVLRSGSLLIPPASTSAAASVAAGGTGNIRTAVAVPENAGKITFRDAVGQVREIYFAAPSTELSPDAYELPPMPPGDLFDVRYASQRILETFGHQGTSQMGAAITITGAEWPLEIEYAGDATDLSPSLAVFSADGERVYDLSAGGTVRLERTGLISLRVRSGSETGNALPAEYRLYQNYPNPFNPSTKVIFDLPEAARVKIVLTNSLGQTAMKVLDEEMGAGRHVIGIEGAGLAGGVYFCRMRAGSFSDMKKMILVK
ncbi:MAG TPA: T9SS type A sorting domain-containing protein [Bacteroidota bacterium]|nr:T9SS type A sorting domain-containing protein [Bacteroidota bacterium]